MITEVNLHQSVLKNNLSQYNLEDNVTLYKDCCIVKTETGYRKFGEDFKEIEGAYKKIDIQHAMWETRNNFSNAF